LTLEPGPAYGHDDSMPTPLKVRVKRASATLLLSLGLVAPAHATPSAQDVTLAETLFRDAKRLMEEQKYTEACAKFAESHRLDPAGGTLLNLAVCYDKAGLTASAWVAYSDALVLARNQNRLDRVETIEERLKGLEPRLSRLTVVVASPTDELEVLLDGTPVRRPAWNVAVPIDPGKHQVRARAPGFEEFSIEVEVAQEKSDLTVTVPALTPSAATPAEGAPSPAEAPTDEGATAGQGKRTTGIILGGAGVALIGVGSYFGIRALGQMSDSDSECPNGRCTARGAKLSQDANTSANIANVTIGVGLVAIGVGAYFFITGNREMKAQRSFVVPVVSHRSAGLVFQSAL
jgi:hypothetical protein